MRGEPNLLDLPEFAPQEIGVRRAELDARGFAVCGLSSSVRFDYPEESAREEQVRIGKAYLELADDLGASFIRVFGDVLPPDNPHLRQVTLRNIASGLQRLGEAAEQRGLQVLIETHGDFADSRLMVELLSRVKSPAVGVLWDTHHPWRFFHENLAETFERLKPWVRHTHWKDSIERAAPANTEATEDSRAADERARKLMSGHRPGDYVLFGEGEFPAEECLRILREGDYRGWFSLEWEKAWHPEIESPEIALPPFPGVLKRLAGGTLRGV